MNEVILVIGMMLVTFGARYPVLALVSKLQLPEIILRALKFVPPVVLTAIILPAVLISDQKLQIDLNNAPLFASIIAAIISWKYKNLLLTIIIGMMVFWSWKNLLGN